ncbi:TPA: phage regulatory CII family protein [Yersinia enterocolitica]|uniref:Regulatory protein CII n=4 Tax=Enterobacterales TaxID=91347 RepID=A0A0H5EYU4_YEREN|nr:phage regulatory CII family protein [Yersinia enterocolitica]EKN3327405.1 phage regulatory CII family protein [Yersinia enterocolitica]EKN3331751.1 phage regulatory CII family protein [Yersinia enterocolitica]EKN3351565.1 phage regulatory CII family protein [Yersinia enterocolitica]EKN3359557.1 phage regulatory CII family protein [Yersinia enterocolitica]EKN3366295.1 phage regulatory CII family protein [Yersinia enterocolitica]
MFDFSVSKHPHFENACRQFPTRHNLTQLAKQLDMNAQTLRNKLNPEQPHHLTVTELLAITDATEDASLIDAMLAQINCMPSVPVNEASADNISTYALKATAAVGLIAAAAVQGDHKTASRKSSLLDTVNTAIRHLSLIGLTVQARIQSTPALASTVDVISGLGAVAGLS